MVDEGSGPVTVQEMYGDWDWDHAVDVVGRSLKPRPSTSLFDTVEAVGVGPDDVVLDIGGRDGHHSLIMAERFRCRAVSVDPVEANLAQGRTVLADHDVGHLVELRLGSIEAIPAEDDEFDVVLSRDMMGHVEDPSRGLAECVRVLRPGGVMVMHQVFATPLLEPRERQLVCDYTATIPERLSVEGFEAAVTEADFTIESLDLVGSEWVESSQEAGTVPNYLLQVSRLRRAREQLMAELGEVAYRVVYGNALWSIYLLLGKLESRLYVLRAPDRKGGRSLSPRPAGL